MTMNRPRKVAAVLLLVSLLCVAVPAVAAPERATGETSIGRPLLQTLMAWLAGVWPEGESHGAPERLWEALGSGLDPGGTPNTTTGEPTAQPRLGDDLDPNG